MITLTAKLVAAYLRNNPVAATEIPALIQSTHAALVKTATAEPPPAERPAPAVSIKKSITPDAIICLECGKPQKMIRRHLATAHGLSVEDYRAKWSLADDYPMVAPNYSQHRTALALKIGLGRKKAVVTAEPAAPAAATTAPRRPGSRKKPVG